MKINTQLYGGSSLFSKKETPLSADEILCDYSDTCSLYKDNKCLRCRSYASPICKFGTTITTKGYTSRAKKYYQFKTKYENDPTYNKLKYPTELAGVMNNHLFLNTTYVNVRKRMPDDCGPDINGYIVKTAGFGSPRIFIPLEDITNELLYAIFSYSPTAMFGGKIEKYNNKVVPEILQTMKKIVPDVYNEFISEYPQYDIAPNYIGKKAYIYSLKPNTTFKYEGYTWVFDGEYISTNNFELGSASPWWLQEKSYSDVKIKVTEKMTIEINDNSIVDENTKFE